MDDNEQPILNIVGDLVALGPLRRDLVPLYQLESPVLRRVYTREEI